MKAFQCEACHAVYCDPWISTEARKWIFSVGTPQHNVGWSNFFGWAERDQRYCDHIRPHLIALWDEILRTFPGKVTSYAEVNCPFNGLLPVFAELQRPQIGQKDVSTYFRNQRSKATHPRSQRTLSLPTLSLRKRLSRAKPENGASIEAPLPYPEQRYLLLVPSHVIWGRNCNALGTSCHATAQEMLGASLLYLEELRARTQPLDVFAFINTLDHTDEPLKIVETALAHARLVVIENHGEANLGKQHLWGLSEDTMARICQSKGWNFADQTDKVLARKKSEDRVYFLSKEIKFA
jgi:hypothetical protein